MNSPEPVTASPGGWRFRRGLAWGRKAWWVEILTILAGYFIYELVQGSAPKDHALALRNGQRVHDLQRWLHIDIDPGINHFVNDHHPLALITGYDYDILHYAMTTTVLVLLWWRRPLVYGRWRSALVGSSIASLAVFWLLPVAPPRFVVTGIVDTLVQNHIFGTVTPPDHPPPLVNVDAAMPSLHVGWSLWCAVTIIGTTRIWFRWIAALYPVWTTFVVIGTGNHYLLDAVGGLIVLGAGLVVTAGPLSGWRTVDPPGPDGNESSTVGSDRAPGESTPVESRATESRAVEPKVESRDVESKAAESRAADSFSADAARLARTNRREAHAPTTTAPTGISAKYTNNR
jgi:PAP2 superfamily